MQTVKEILARKGGNALFSIAPDTKVGDALLFMVEKNIGALPVMEGDLLIGIFSERDYARKIILLVQAGASTDAVIDSLVPLLEAGDIVIDGGNEGRSEDDGAAFLLPYWMGRYLGYLAGE